MKFSLIVEDDFGPEFIKKIFRKKFDEGLLSGRLESVTQSLINNKLRRKVNAALRSVERVIVLMDADGEPFDKKTENIKQYLDSRHRDRIRIVLLDYEIEEWICYSQKIRIGNEKPSKVLKRTKRYTKNSLPKFATKLDCERLMNCPSFRRLVNALESNGGKADSMNSS